MHSDWLGIICAHAKAPMQVALEEARSISNFLILDTEEATSLHAFWLAESILVPISNLAPFLID